MLVNADESTKTVAVSLERPTITADGRAAAPRLGTALSPEVRESAPGRI
jgi:hypothetical protein